MESQSWFPRHQKILICHVFRTTFQSSWQTHEHLARRTRGGGSSSLIAGMPSMQRKNNLATWPLDEVLVIKRRQQAMPIGHEGDECVGEDDQSGNPVESILRPPNVPDSVVVVVSGQFDAIPQVSTSKSVYFECQVFSTGQNLRILLNLHWLIFLFVLFSVQNWYPMSTLSWRL